ncbi:hypothetical protein P8935_13755 [Telmatobacter sp. DSM 110680]|uniref:Uncharacterized protein n=1 Tax=Telmatobacter sp. DSM 110680 TaxID=3036704 RepID=A0AAU7DCU0_9BACT
MIAKPPVAEPAGTVTDFGAVSAPLLLDSDTTVWLVAVALRYTEHDFVVGPVIVCVPHETIVKLGVAAAAGYNVITSVLITPPAFPVSVTFTDLLTAAETALNPTLEAPVAIRTEAGTCSEALLLVSEIFVELVAGALR